MINLKTDEDSYQKLHGAMTQSVTIRDPKGIIDKVVADDGSEVYVYMKLSFSFSLGPTKR